MSFGAISSMLMKEKVKAAPVVETDEELEKREIFKSGFIEPQLFDVMFEGDARVRTASEESDDEYEDIGESIGDTATTVSWDTVLDGEKMEVCSKFLKDECDLNSCPLAHPGVRDKAKIFYCRSQYSVNCTSAVLLSDFL